MDKQLPLEHAQKLQALPFRYNMDIKNYAQQRELEEAAKVRSQAQSLDLPWPRFFKHPAGKPSKSFKYKQTLYELVVGNDSLIGISPSCPSWWEAGMSLKTWVGKTFVKKWGVGWCGRALFTG
eukprot:142432-Amphidinium_carterae.1